ncbi:MAG TPA: GNAT family N-acetyltransferase [Anaerolineales bacterium]|nr:GNAT family N-acetyltransferase [Anaerolineales bacterium]
MSSVTMPVKVEEHPHVRPLNVLRDLSTVADLIELCFAPTMDNEGQRYLSDMRRASRDDGFLKWANHLAESTSLPLTGYVWEENGRIVGNASLIPFRDKGKRVYLIANVAVHPDHRGHGIGQALTRLAMQHAFDKKAKAVWLHVRDDNPAAIRLYANLNFREIARRTTWQTRPDAFSPKLNTDIEILPRHANFWPTQWDWLLRLYPDALGWYHGWNFNPLRPGLANWFYLMFVDYSIKQWAAVRGNELLATLTWMPQGGKSDSLFAAIGENSDPEAITELLIHARRALASYSKLSLDFPDGEMTDAITAAGFKPRRTLIWMKAERDE